MHRVGIVGNGFVGNAVYQNFKDSFETSVYDASPARTYNSLGQVLQSDFVFVCLPTPMVSPQGGGCDLTILMDFFNNLPNNLKCLFIIKSTVPIGTTKAISANRPDLKIVHSPEFLTAKNAVNDFANPSRNVVGGPIELATTVKELYQQKYGVQIPILLTSSDESEAIKYFSNSFLALKVSYFNVLFQLADKMGFDYCTVVSGIISDPRIGSSHTSVPGPDGFLGYGGTCFPKDINSLISTLNSHNVNCSILEQSWEYNKEIREMWDWASNPSAVSQTLSVQNIKE